jgi:hypothetical protein
MAALWSDGDAQRDNERDDETRKVGKQSGVTARCRLGLRFGASARSSI